MSLAIVSVCALSALVFGGGGYWLSSKFWNSSYSGRNTGGDGGGPSGGVFAAMGGALLGMWFFLYVGPYLFSADIYMPAGITAMVAGFVGGTVAMMRGNRGKK